MVLSGEEIRARQGKDIHITPFCEECLNPNSYNLTLHDEILVYEEVVLDVKHPNRFRRITIPEEGMILSPGQIFLGRTVEHTETHNLVPMIEGRSSIARLGLFVHCSSGFGDVGFRGHWTIEMFAVQPIRIYAGIRICQIFYHELVGDVREYASEKYQNNRDVQPGMLYKEFAGCREYDQLELNFGSVSAKRRDDPSRDDSNDRVHSVLDGTTHETMV
ncbi:MAG: dCTP deaminase [Planctomycetota bacterium]|nr:dCTP deaminase [Planctomycetota bacterium]